MRQELGPTLDLEAAEFDEMWDQLREAMKPDLAAALAELEQMNFEINPAELEAIISQLRNQELAKLLELVGSALKAEIAAIPEEKAMARDPPSRSARAFSAAWRVGFSPRE